MKLFEATKAIRFLQGWFSNFRSSSDDLLKFVVIACQPNAPPQLVEQMHGLAQSLQSPEALPEMHALGRVLAAILTGERHPDLSALPPELASKIREHWAALSAQS